MKIIFLDFDGVLNSYGYLRRTGQAGLCLDPSRLDLLGKIVDATDAKLVLTSSWREHWSAESSSEIDRIFAEHRMTVYGKTPHLRSGREQEIRAWLAEHPAESFVVLDDRFLNADFLDGHFILTSNLRDGLDQEDVRRAIAILKGETQ